MYELYSGKDLIMTDKNLKKVKTKILSKGLKQSKKIEIDYKKPEKPKKKEPTKEQIQHKERLKKIKFKESKLKDEHYGAFKLKIKRLNDEMKKMKTKEDYERVDKEFLKIFDEKYYLPRNSVELKKEFDKVTAKLNKMYESYEKKLEKKVKKFYPY